MNYLATITCPSCATAKSADQFYKCKARKSGLLKLCKVCEKDRVNKWNTANRDRNKTRKRLSVVKHVYGLSPQAYEKLQADHNNSCAICGIDEASAVHGTLCVDHDHNTGVIRGLLCHHCNAGLGHYKDSLELLERAANYLKEKQPSIT